MENQDEEKSGHRYCHWLTGICMAGALRGSKELEACQDLAGVPVHGPGSPT